MHEKPQLESGHRPHPFISVALPIVMAVIALAGLLFGPGILRSFSGQTATTPPAGRTSSVAADTTTPVAADEWEKSEAERKEKEKADAAREAVERARVSKYWRTVSKGDTLDKVFAILGEPRLKPGKDARTGKAHDGILLYTGDGGLCINIWHEKEKVTDVLAAVWRETKIKPELVAKNWRDVKVGDSAEGVLRRLGGPSGRVGYDIGTDEIVNQDFLFYDNADVFKADLTLFVDIKNGKVASVRADNR